MYKKNKDISITEKVEANETFVNHLKVLRYHLIICVLFTVVAIALSYFNLNYIIKCITKPLIELKLYNMVATSVTETFVTYLNIAITTAITVCTPFYMWQFYLFIRPALLKNEKKYAISILISFVFMFLVGCIIFYYAILPNALKFLVSYKNPMPITVQFNISVAKYVQMFINTSLSFGIAMQMPILIILLVKIGIINIGALKKFRKFAIPIIFTISGIITPPDIPSQLIMGAVLMLCYEIPIIAFKFIKTNAEILAMK